MSRECPADVAPLTTLVRVFERLSSSYFTFMTFGKISSKRGCVSTVSSVCWKPTKRFFISKYVCFCLFNNSSKDSIKLLDSVISMYNQKDFFHRLLTNNLCFPSSALNLRTYRLSFLLCMISKLLHDVLTCFPKRFSFYLLCRIDSKVSLIDMSKKKFSGELS